MLLQVTHGSAFCSQQASYVRVGVWLTVVKDIGGSGMAMFAPQYNIEINNDGTNGQIGPAALKVVYDLGKKAAADFMQQQARDGGRLSGAYR